VPAVPVVPVVPFSWYPYQRMISVHICQCIVLLDLKAKTERNVLHKRTLLLAVVSVTLESMPDMSGIFIF
jgi:hypothetical protein